MVPAGHTIGQKRERPRPCPAGPWKPSRCADYSAHTYPFSPIRCERSFASMQVPAIRNLRKMVHVRVSTRGWALRQAGNLTKRVQQRLRLFKIGRVETFGEPTVDRREEVAGFPVATLIAAESCKAHRGAQFPHLGLLLSGDAQ